MKQASPVLLEPIGTLTVNVSDKLMGDIIGDINKRRGRIIGTNGKTRELITELADVDMAVYGKTVSLIGEMENILVAKEAIEMINKVPKIDRDKCIRCFCCQEFCPVGAMKVHKNKIVKLLTKN